MSWERYETVEDARAAEELWIESAVARGAEVVSDEQVDCLLEGESTACRRVVSRLPFSRVLALGGSNVLVAYYATAVVREQAARVTCSFYDDQAPPGGLAPLCAEVLDLE